MRQLRVRVHRRSADVRRPARGSASINSTSRDATSRVSIGWNRTLRKGPQHGGVPLDREDGGDQFVELRGAQHRMADAGGLERLFDTQFGSVVRQRDRIDADDRHVHEVADSCAPAPPM